MKKCCMLALAMFVFIAAGALAEDTSLVAQNDRFILYADAETGGFCVSDAENGFEWRAIPENAASDKGSKGLAKNKLTSVMYLTVIDSETRKLSTLVSVKADISIEIIDNGYVARFAFADKGLSIPMYVTLSAGGIIVRIPLNEIIEEGSSLVTEIALLPSFFAGAPGESGYILLPDGCGALMEFGRSSYYYDYYEPVYGQNLAFRRTSMGASKARVALPVLGIHKENAGALAIISDGDALASIYAIPCGYESSYDSACARFTLRNTDEQSISSTVFQTVFERELPGCALELTCFFMAGEYSGYDAMACHYREYLSENGVGYSAIKGHPFVFEAYGAVARAQSVLGIPITRASALADVSEVRGFINTIGEAAIIRYVNWSDSEIKRALPTGARALGEIGGDEALRALESEHRVYLNVNPVFFHSPVNTNLHIRVQQACNRSGAAYSHPGRAQKLYRSAVC